MAAPKFNNVDDYINAFPSDVQKILQQLRQTVKTEVPQATETIKYNMPTYVFHGNLVYFAAWKKHVSFYPITREMEEQIPELATYKTSGKGTIQFPYSQPLPLDLIRALIAFRLREHLASQAKGE
ncbi:MAG: DUF1801 domain-containing protein [Chloroflexi bacterium]|nr:DUF1801 domain-containing protein [Chloroflexota bacterium]MCC6896596.1 DUF1801 domain-containing protein [Anaerolineae bacterium]